MALRGIIMYYMMVLSHGTSNKLKGEEARARRVSAHFSLNYYEFHLSQIAVTTPHCVRISQVC